MNLLTDKIRKVKLQLVRSLPAAAGNNLNKVNTDSNI